MAGIETVEVYRDARQAADPHLMGTLHCQRAERVPTTSILLLIARSFLYLSMRQAALAMFR